MPRFVNRALDVATFLCAFVMTGLLVKRELASRRPRADMAKDERVANWRELTSAGHRIGPDSASITIVEFSDFQCPYCARFARQVMPAIRRRHPDAVTVIYRHWPLSIHPFATDAAVASECASHQERFEAFHDALFSYQDSIGAWSFDRFAQLARVPDLKAFAKCRSGQAARATVERDRQLAMALGARGTPTFIMDGVMLAGALTASRVDSAVSEAKLKR